MRPLGIKVVFRKAKEVLLDLWTGTREGNFITPGWRDYCEDQGVILAVLKLPFLVVGWIFFCFPLLVLGLLVRWWTKRSTGI